MSTTEKRRSSSKRIRSSPPITENLQSQSTRQIHRSLHDTSTPYNHSVLYPLCPKDFMKSVFEEARSNMTATFKETDLFKVFQTGDLSSLSSSESPIPHLMKLRETIYSKEFREFVQAITGCTELTDRIDCSANAYVGGCHLLCHDDVIGTRCVSYIIYLTDPDEPWNVEDGGGLELYPLEEAAGYHSSQPMQGVPAANPSNVILPRFNSMVLFQVQPGRSYHAVQEVFADGKPRLSISGWYHAATPPPGSSGASLSRIMTKGDVVPQRTPIPASIYPPETEDEVITEADMGILSQWINPIYLEAKSIAQICETFAKDSSIQLHGFLKEDIATIITDSLVEADTSDALGKSRPPRSYAVGTEGSWDIRGPPHKQRYLEYTGTTPSSSKKLSGCSVVVGEVLADLTQSLFRSPAFYRYLRMITGIQPTAHADEIRRFRPGLDYTVAHHGTLVDSSCLDATLCFVSSSTEEEADEWDSGDVGGFECYIEADEDADAAATAEVYRAQDEDDDTQLLSIQAGSNVLNVVMRDPGVMRFIKYVSHRAPSSRWDVSMEFEMETADTSSN